MNTKISKLWVLGTACVILAAIAWLHTYATTRNAKWDFPQFYIAAHIPLTELYNRQSFEAVGRTLLSREGVSYFPPYVRPAVFALPLKVLQGIPYSSAYRIWAAFQILLVFCSGLLICRTFPELPHIWFLPFLGSFPVFYGIIFGQDGAVMLLLLSASLYCLTRGSTTLGGILLGIGLYKFNLILLVPFYLLVAKQWRALISFGITAGVIAALSVLLAPASDYVNLLAHISDFAAGFTTENMLGMRGLSATTGLPWLYSTGVIVIAPLTLFAAWKADVKTGYSIALAGSMLCAFHINGYDGTLASIPLVALMARLEDTPLRLLVAASVVWIGRPPIWFSPIILIAVFVGLIADRFWRTTHEASY